MRVFAVALLLPLAFATPLATPSTSSQDAEASLAPIFTTLDHIDDAYIVVFKKGILQEQIAMHLSTVEGIHGADPLYSFASDGQIDTGGVNHVYAPSTSGFGYFGYAGKFSSATVNSIRASPEVAYVEHDQVMKTQDDVHGVDDWNSTPDETVDDDLAPKKGNDTVPGIVTEIGAPWGLARISHRPQLHLSTFTKYLYKADGGEGVTAYIIDTGINIDHVEFGGRASWGKTIPQNDVDKDGNGHGTHCAGTIGSRRYGVAKAAHLVAVKVLGSNGSGSMSDVVAGVVWAAEQAADAAVTAAKELIATGKTKHKGSVANMSLGGGKAKSLDDAVNAAVEAGLHFAVAAGNDGKDACNYSPAGAVNAVTVGASNLADERAYFSNHGKCVDVFAPGLNILSTWTGGNETSNTISGTSMASPHICGLLAYLLSIHGTDTFNIVSDADNTAATAAASLYDKAYSLLPRMAQAVLPTPSDAQMPFDVSPDGDEFRPTPKPGNGNMTPAQLKKALIALASPGMLQDLPTGTPNLLAFNNATLPEKRN